MAIVYSHMAKVEEAMGDYKTAMEYGVESLKLNTSINDSIMMASSLTNIISIHNRLKQYDLALEKQMIVLDIYTRYNNLKPLKKLYSNIGNTYGRMGVLDSAEYYFLKVEMLYDKEKECFRLFI